MNAFINQLAFGWYPYLAVTVLVVGSILRFDASQYSWRAQSSQFLRRRQTCSTWAFWSCSAGISSACSRRSTCSTP